MTYHDSDNYDIQFTTRQLVMLFGLLTVIVGGVFVGGIAIGRGMQPAAAVTARSQPPKAAEPLAGAPVPPSLSAPAGSAAEAAENASENAGDQLQLPVGEPSARTAETRSESPDQLAASTLSVATGSRKTPPSRNTAGPPVAAAREERAPARSSSSPPLSPAAGGAAAESQGKFTIQVAAFRDRAAAENLLAQLAGKGIDGYLEATPAGIFRVRVGRFGTREAARALAARLESEQFATLVTSR